MKKVMCKPCSLGEIAAGKKVVQTGVRWEKITCAVCGRRRFGTSFEVTRNTKKARSRKDEGV